MGRNGQDRCDRSCIGVLHNADRIHLRSRGCCATATPSRRVNCSLRPDGAADCTRRRRAPRPLDIHRCRVAHWRASISNLVGLAAEPLGMGGLPLMTRQDGPFQGPGRWLRTRLLANDAPAPRALVGAYLVLRASPARHSLFIILWPPRRSRLVRTPGWPRTRSDHLFGRGVVKRQARSESGTPTSCLH